jgi:tetratricopeptide (TPR) repeat protein
VKARLCVAVLAALSGAATVARAGEPTLWQRAQEPGAALRYKARVRAEQLFDQGSETGADAQLLRDLSLGGAALLQLSGGARRDPWQAVLLGRILLDAAPAQEREALALLEGSVHRLPDSDFKRASLFDAGLGAMLSGDLEQADRDFTEALSLAWSPDYRASIHRNRGKVRMLAGRLREAVSDFRAAVQLARGVEVMALAHFGLGVALERSGDFPQGLQQIARGVALRLPVPPYPSESVLDLPSLRWFPEYDVHYFRALGAMSEAAEAPTSEVARDRYELAIESWEQYLPAAEASKDRFFPNAARLHRRCLSALARLPREPSSGVR